MPFSHVGVTVSHLPQACSFFLSALQPLGYRYIGKQGNQIGFGAEDADFFLSPSNPGITPTTAHIAFSAPSRSAVREFYAAALKAGGYPNGEPASRGEDDSLFNAAVSDLDGNSIEVIHREDAAPTEIGYATRSRVLTWRRRTDEPGLSNDAHSQITACSSKSSLQSSAANAVESLARSKAPSIPRSVSEASAIPTTTATSEKTSSGISTKAVIGTLLGAAAGAAVAYAMVRSEQESAREEGAFKAAMDSKASQAAPQSSDQMGQSDVKSTRSKKPHRNYSTTESQAPESVFDMNRSVTTSEFYGVPRNSSSRLALEAAPEPLRFDQVETNNYRSPEYVSLAPTRIGYAPTSVALSKAPSRITEQQVEYVPASSVMSRPSIASRRTQTAPSTVRGDPLPLSHQMEDAPASQARQTENDWAEENMVVARRDSAMSDYSVQSSKSKRSSHSHGTRQPSFSHAGSTRSRRSENREPSEERASHVSRASCSTKARSAISRTSSSHASRRDAESSKSRYSEYGEPPRNGSTVVGQRSNQSFYSDRDRDESPERGSEASTVRPGRSTQSSVANIPLPVSRKTSVLSAAELPLPMSRRSSYYSAAEYTLPNSRKTSVVSAMDVPLPGSRKTSVASGMSVPLSASPADSVISARKVPLPQSRAGSIVGSILGRDHYRSSENGSAAAVPLPESRTGTGSIVGSILGRSSEAPPESRMDYADTVVPDDSISCVASRRHRERSPSESRSRSRRKESRHRSTRESRHSSKVSRRSRAHSKDSKKSSASKRHRNRQEGESLPALPPSEVGSTSTMTPAKYRKDSAFSLPISSKSRTGIEKDERRGKKSFMSAVMGH